ncbi:stage VI sporulation protein D [Rossellomorea marisflavi]|uniref:stage VI sporulation protein D n=1 Tax=Rossellomorea marisflavi TaxID=189381 RepID=UPI002852F84C|nr:stage VI sporulation protein D [Rossellomorea marisflavi]MDR4936097.1 stage VI sporulation protein D [Rossellomorea marisflavi]
MSQQSSLRFSLEESIWFKKGQEVEELLSISLDPHITIQEQEQYILIRGSLDLSGEYLPSSVRDDDEAYEVDEILEASGKYVQMVESREKGELEFIHCFPVDVTIPKNRIENLEDIDVYVEAFDYAVPENACIRLNADLTITGIFGDQQVQTPVEEELYEPMYRAVDTMEEVEAEEAEVTLETVVPDYVEEPPREEEYDVSTLSPAYDEAEDEEEPEETEETEPFVLEGRVTPEEEEIPVQIQYESFPEPEAMRSEKMFELPEHELSESSEDQTYQHHAQEPVQPPVQLPVQEVMEVEEEEEEESSSSSEVEAAKEKAKGKKKKYESISLTDFFARKEEERGATLRVCIVQDGDTLDSIAEKYELTIPQLLRVNQLEANQDVYGGQVLYIPPEEPAFR